MQGTKVGSLVWKLDPACHNFLKKKEEEERSQTFRKLDLFCVFRCAAGIQGNVLKVDKYQGETNRLEIAELESMCQGGDCPWRLD